MIFHKETRYRTYTNMTETVTYARAIKKNPCLKLDHLMI